MNREIRIQLFGAFRQYSSERDICIHLPEQATVASLREAFSDTLDDDNARALLRSSAFATDEAVLEESDPLPATGRVSILPPVCGG